MTTSLVLLLVVVAVGGYGGWRWTQDQYYVGADRGRVAIFRGVSERIAGWNLSKPYQLTGILLDQVPSNDVQTVRTAYATGVLAQVQKTVTNIGAAVAQCHQQYAMLQTWVDRERAYQAQVAQARLRHKPTNNVEPPGARPSPVGAMCAPPEAFGIPAADLVPPAGTS